MVETVHASVFHPHEDGFADEKHFLRLLTAAFQLASGGGRKRVDLRKLQLALLRRGWRP